jgi:hypothetical protein
MQGRSWMAALTIAAGVASLALTAKAGDPPKSSKVRLEIHIAGLKRAGCDVEVKPGSPTCRFRAGTQHIPAEGHALFVFDDVKSQSADRECAFAITIREAGQPERTYRRSVRLAPPHAAVTQASLACYLYCPSSLIATDESKTRR